MATALQALAAARSTEHQFPRRRLPVRDAYRSTVWITRIWVSAALRAIMDITHPPRAGLLS
jgi:hypothetical protein